MASSDDDPRVTVGGGAHGTSTNHVGSNEVASRLNLTEPKEGGSDLIVSRFMEDDFDGTYSRYILDHC